MSASAIISLFHDLIITAGIYALVGFEITPATMIGFLTILGYSLYDTVVVFDKVRENTREELELTRRTFPEAVNLAVNQTLVRSINTAVVAVLPVASILFIGAFALGADTLRDISLALLIGIIVGTYSTIFLAAPMYSQFREGEAAIKKHDAKVRAARPKAAAAAAPVPVAAK
jgi:preprotein translocase subunit SecF